MLRIKNLSGSIRLNIILVLILSVLIIVIIQKPGINNQANFEKISLLDIKNIKKIEIISIDKQKIVFTKNNLKWNLSSNNNETVINPEKMKFLFNLLNASSLENFPAAKEQLAQFHLLNPRITVKFDEFTIAFGNSEPLKHRRYILVEEKVHLIADLHYHFLLQPASAYLTENQ